MISTSFVDFIILICLSSCDQLTQNVAYNGAFNQQNHDEHILRRLQSRPSSTDLVKFYHGIASGDPTDHDVLLWTRVTPPFQNALAQNIYPNTTYQNIYEYISVKWAVSTIYNLDLSQNKCDNLNYVNCGTTETSSHIDYTVKIIADGLQSDTWYYYQFAVGNTTSEIGRTRTVPSASADVVSWRFAFGSCKQYSHGYFSNLGDIARRNDIDMMVFLGDYIYEFPNDDLVNGSDINRIPYPNNFLYNLTHYRLRYLQHHLDENAQAAHKRFPWFIVWDDHEVVNNYWYNGTASKWQNDELFNVDFHTRKKNAYQAFFEWTQIKPIDYGLNKGLYRAQRFGNLFDLILVDARSQRTELCVPVTYEEMRFKTLEIGIF